MFFMKLHVIYKSYLLFFFVSFFLVCIVAKAQDDLINHQAGNANPKYKRASYTNENISLDNGQIRLDMFRRIGGWGWGEISTPSGKLMAVLEHLGELKLRDQDIPMRFEADSVWKKSGAEGESLVFKVKSVVVREKLKGTSFDDWMRYPFTTPAMVGEVILTLSPDQPLIYLKYRLEATGNYSAQYIRGPWLKVGEAAFDTEKDDAIFPGVEWAIDKEWTSGIDWFKDPWALRVAPHPNKVSIPLMALSHQGAGIGMSWIPNQTVTRWFNCRGHKPQPVFAVPNFVDRMNNNLMGLMVPDATIEGHENELYAAQPLELRIGQIVSFDAEIWLSKGNSLDVVVDWVRRHGFPEPSEPKWSFEQTLENIANAYNTNFWHEGKGFGILQRPEDKIYPRIPEFLERYVRENKKTPLANDLQKKLEWNRRQLKDNGRNKPDEKQLIARGDELLKLQGESGAFFFDPDGRHYRKDDFKVATSFVEPMGLKDDTALDIVMLPALELLDIAKATGKEKYEDAARRALEFCMAMKRPEGGDFWETPLHAPNLLAAGHAAIAYYEGYKYFNDDRYKEKAIYWIRSLIPFTHLWEPADVKMLYNTKPVLSSSDWYFANWVRDHVQWEVLSVFAKSSRRNISWEDIDTELAWDRYHEGITVAAIRWMTVHTEGSWRPHNLPATYAGYQNGDYDYTYPDTYNSTTGNYGGMFIMPDPIAINIYAILDKQSK